MSKILAEEAFAIRQRQLRNRDTVQSLAAIMRQEPAPRMAKGDSRKTEKVIDPRHQVVGLWENMGRFVTVADAALDALADDLRERGYTYAQRGSAIMILLRVLRDLQLDSIRSSANSRSIQDALATSPSTVSTGLRMLEEIGVLKVDNSTRPIAIHANPRLFWRGTKERQRAAMDEYDALAIEVRVPRSRPRKG